MSRTFQTIDYLEQGNAEAARRLEALPEYSVVIDQDGFAYQLEDGFWRGALEADCDSATLLDLAPLTVVYRPTWGLIS